MDHYVYSGAAGAGTGADWANAFTTLNGAFAAGAAGDRFFVAHDHAQTQASSLNLASPGSAGNPCLVFCVDRAGSVPPVSDDLRTTATITVTASNATFVINGNHHIYGVQFVQTASHPASVFFFGNSGASYQDYERCLIAKRGTAASQAAISLGAGSNINTVDVTFNNTVVEFGATGDGIAVRGARFTWLDTPEAIAGALPSTLFTSSIPVGGLTLLKGVDLSALGSGKTLVASYLAAREFYFVDCKLGAGVNVAATPSVPGAGRVFVVRSDSAGTNYRHEKYQYMGTQVVETTIVRTGGTVSDAVALAWRLNTTANAKWVLPFTAIPLAVPNSVTGSPINVTLEGLVDPRTLTTLPNNDDIWFDVEYLGSAASPLCSVASGTKADNLAAGSALTASNEAWDSLVTSRANSTAYSEGDSIKVASNPGRVFICTTAGNSDSAEPAGYAAAVDGGAVTDGTAVFKAAVRFKQTITFTPAMKGAYRIHLKAAKASGIFYIDPKPVVS